MDDEKELLENEENNDVQQIKKEVKARKSNHVGMFIVVALIFTVLNIGIIVGGDYIKPLVESAFSKSGSTTNDKKTEEFKFKDVVYNDVNNYGEGVEKPGISGMVKSVNNAIVAITTKTTVTDWFDMEYDSEGAGSGIIFNITDDKVMIATNQHVVANANKVTVTLLVDKTYIAYSVGSDVDTDLAVIYINKKDIEKDVLDKLVAAKFGNSDELEVGEQAIAIGNPLGSEFTNTVTVGIISALNREIEVSNRKYKLIQTDAAINPGNSGGALLNYKGEVIGINSVKIVDTTVEGIGFAIPSNTAKPIIEELVNNGNIKRPFLGIYGADITDSLSDLYELPVGVYVQNVVKNGSAGLAGIEKGDVIISADGQKILSMEQLTNIIKNHKVGDSITIKYIRELKDKKEVKVKLQDKSTYNQGSADDTDSEENIREKAVPRFNY
ncbi:MAG TPA: hypothetical protein DEP72_08885 [Clostridiales bacterium]|nr:MAG: hypothetical protein A2Y18_03825 [Clostridiales bacterium GWD2_32_19]HCC08254.1 hypothetical protein [Clostridiales bacterium]